VAVAHQHKTGYFVPYLKIQRPGHVPPSPLANTTQPNPLKQLFDPFPTQPNPTRGSTQPTDNSTSSALYRAVLRGRYAVWLPPVAAKWSSYTFFGNKAVATFGLKINSTSCARGDAIWHAPPLSYPCGRRKRLAPPSRPPRLHADGNVAAVSHARCTRQTDIRPTDRRQTKVSLNTSALAGRGHNN